MMEKLTNLAKHNHAEFIISLDFELLWGVRDHSDKKKYGQNILGARKAIPAILELFSELEIAATWATVGFLFCENKEELLDILPKEAFRPNYHNSSLSSYNYIDELGDNEVDDPYYYGSSLIRNISETPKQEIATHTLSHYYCLEAVQNIANFEIDLANAIKIANRKKYEIKSIVFPRNQYDQQHIDVCEKLGISAYRGNPDLWAYKSANGDAQTNMHRAARLLDAHLGVLGSKTFCVNPAPIRNIPASQYLRPNIGRLAVFHPLHVQTIKRAMTNAAKNKLCYHLWWHPHNFGLEIERNLAGLRSVLKHYIKLKDEYGMISKTMGESGI